MRESYDQMRGHSAKEWFVYSIKALKYAGYDILDYSYDDNYITAKIRLDGIDSGLHIVIRESGNADSLSIDYKYRDKEVLDIYKKAVGDIIVGRQVKNFEEYRKGDEVEDEKTLKESINETVDLGKTVVKETIGMGGNSAVYNTIVDFSSGFSFLFAIAFVIIYFNKTFSNAIDYFGIIIAIGFAFAGILYFVVVRYNIDKLVLPLFCYLINIMVATIIGIFTPYIYLWGCLSMVQAVLLIFKDTNKTKRIIRVGLTVVITFIMAISFVLSATVFNTESETMKTKTSDVSGAVEMMDLDSEGLLKRDYSASETIDINGVSYTVESVKHNTKDASLGQDEQLVMITLGITVSPTESDSVVLNPNDWILVSYTENQAINYDEMCSPVDYKVDTLMKEETLVANPNPIQRSLVFKVPKSFNGYRLIHKTPTDVEDKASEYLFSIIIPKNFKKE